MDRSQLPISEYSDVFTAFLASARCWSDRTALVADGGRGQSFTYGDTAANAGRLAAGLKSRHLVAPEGIGLLSENRPEWTYRLTLPMVPLALAGHLFLIPRMGALGAAVVTAVVAMLGAVGAMTVAYTLLDDRPSLRSLSASGCASLAAAFPAFLWSAYGVMVVVKILVIVGIIIAALVAMGEFTRSELKTIRSLLPAGVQEERCDGGWK